MIRSGKSSPCPVCGRTKDADCSWYEDGQTVLCKTYSDGSTIPDGWEYLGESSNGFQGKFVKKFAKKIREKKTTHYYYPDRSGAPLMRACRTDDGQGNKTFWQQYWDGYKWQKGCPEEIRSRIPIYNYQAVIDAIANNEQILVVEGESAVDRLAEIGITATTTIGGSGGYSRYGSYLRDLERARLILAPDRDANGVKYIAKFERDFLNQIEGYFLAGTEALWRNPQGGMDIYDEIEDGATKQDILNKIILPERYQEIISRDRSKSTKERSQSNAKDYAALASELGMNLAIVNEDGVPKSKLIKLKLDLYELLGDRLRLNLMSRDYELDGKPIDINTAKLFVSELLGYDASTENCILAIHSIASRNEFHPVRNYLDSLPKDAIDFDLLDNLATLFMDNADPLANVMLRKKLIAAVARAKNPGIKDDTLLVLQGKQGAGKSSFLSVLAGEWFNDDLRDLDNKDELAKLSRFWILELAEVDYLFGKREVEQFKRFLSATTDTYRPPYGRANIQIPRGCAFFASTNKAEFLQDPTGDRRYWVVKVNNSIDLDLLSQMRDRIWATAIAAYDRGDIWWLTKEEEEERKQSHEEYRESDPWQELIRFSDLPTKNHFNGKYLMISDIYERLNIPTHQRDKRTANRIGKILLEYGFYRRVIKVENKATKVWWIDAEVTQLTQLEERWVTSSNPLPDSSVTQLTQVTQVLKEEENIEKPENGNFHNSGSKTENLQTPVENLGYLGNLGNSGSGQQSQELPNSKKMGYLGNLEGNPLAIGTKIKNKGYGDTGKISDFRIEKISYPKSGEIEVHQFLINWDNGKTFWVNVDVVEAIE